MRIVWADLSDYLFSISSKDYLEATFTLIISTSSFLANFSCLSSSSLLHLPVFHEPRELSWFFFLAMSQASCTVLWFSKPVIRIIQSSNLEQLQWLKCDWLFSTIGISSSPHSETCSFWYFLVLDNKWFFFMFPYKKINL